MSAPDSERYERSWTFCAEIPTGSGLLEIRSHSTALASAWYTAEVDPEYVSS